jgi:hypothetical protein
VTLPRGAVDLTIHGTYTNWAAGAVASGAGLPSTFTGETLALGADFGANGYVAQTGGNGSGNVG